MLYACTKIYMCKSENSLRKSFSNFRYIHFFLWFSRERNQKFYAFPFACVHIFMHVHLSMSQEYHR